jgi:dienelactone hydrolase
MRIRHPGRTIRAAVPVLLVVLMAIAVLAPAGAFAQSPAPASPPPGASSSPVVLEPFTDEAYGLRSVAPVGWIAAGMGIRTRDTASGDPTLLALQSAPVPPDALWPSLLPQLGLTAAPEPIAQRDTPAGLRWELYQIPIGGGTAIADLGIAQGTDVTYLALLVSQAAEAAGLREAVFLPAVDALAPLVVERTPLPSGIGYTEQDVSLPGGATDVTLAGTLTMPLGEGPHPAVVLMSGSGPQDRDESLPGMTLKPFALLADALARAGVAVLRYDDRGTAASTGDYPSATLADFTADGHAAFEWLRQQPGIDPARVGVLGHSEGGAYVATIGADDPDVAFVVGLAPMVRPGIELMLDQTRAIARSQGLTSEQAEATVDANRRLYEAALSDDPDELERVTRVVMGEVWDGLDAEMQAQAGDRATWVEQQVAAQVPTLGSPWFRALLRADPSADWARVDAPALGVFGGKDVQVIAGPESTALQQALDGRDDRSRVEVIADANHLFQTTVTGGVEEYPTLDQAFAPELLPLVTDWVREVTGLDG